MPLGRSYGICFALIREGKDTASQRWTRGFYSGHADRILTCLTSHIYSHIQVYEWRSVVIRVRMVQVYVYSSEILVTRLPSECFLEGRRRYVYAYFQYILYLFDLCSGFSVCEIDTISMPTSFLRVISKFIVLKYTGRVTKGTCIEIDKVLKVISYIFVKIQDRRWKIQENLKEI